MQFKTQDEYVAYHSPKARAQRLEGARRANDAAVEEAHQLHLSGNTEEARAKLFAAGISDDGIAYYLAEWGSGKPRI